MPSIITHQGNGKAGDCLNVFRLPARLDVQQTAALLGFQPHDIPVLVAAKQLQPLGKPVPNAQKFFAACIVEELRSNPDWLDKATRTIAQNWQAKNGAKSKANGRTGITKVLSAGR